MGGGATKGDNSETYGAAVDTDHASCCCHANDRVDNDVTIVVYEVSDIVGEVGDCQKVCVTGVI